MKTQTIVRVIFQLVAFGLFVFQMQNSVLKYFAKPVVIESSSKELADIEKPVFHVCQDEQFNYTKAKTIQTPNRFYQGKTEGFRLHNLEGQRWQHNFYGVAETAV